MLQTVLFYILNVNKRKFITSVFTLVATISSFVAFTVLLGYWSLHVVRLG